MRDLTATCHLFSRCVTDAVSRANALRSRGSSPRTRHTILGFRFALFISAILTASACGDDKQASDTTAAPDATATDTPAAEVTPDTSANTEVDASDASDATDATAATDAGAATDATGDTADTGPTNSAAVAITAATGGSVVLGDATLTIPRGALATDTTITVMSDDPGAALPMAATLRGQTYDFGPDGTSFLVPVRARRAGTRDARARGAFGHALDRVVGRRVVQVNA